MIYLHFLQNDLKELWSLLNLLLPEVFDNRKAFHDWFSQPFQKNGPTHNTEDDWLETEKKVIIIHRLYQILEPFMRRRRVEDVEGSLPPKDWHRMMKPAQEQPTKIPAWVKFHDLPFELWNQECLSRVASTIGRPLHVDQATAKTTKQPELLHTKSTRARICIEISAEQDLPDEVTVLVEGDSVNVPIEYQVLPPICKLCHVFGHSSERCVKRASIFSSPSTSTTQVGSQPGNGKHMAVLEQAARDHVQPQMESSNDNRSLPQKQQDANSVDPLNESESEEELLEVLEGVVRSCHEISQPQLHLEGVGSRAVPVHSAVPRSGMVNQTLSPKPPDPQGSEVRDTASKEDPFYQAKTYKPLNNRCMELRKTCNHPLLNYPYFNNFSKDFLVRSCGKLWVLDRILIKL
ncbi:hypothetical protein RHMOL_Rhmol01G0183900 [Rhododendron molle]|uniref:Uncharacterized protein n=1 Tax=Rhododendron molle TaxID=49168 RepID=A0ACC0Q482_RHOML|nr:hypothetical protein RHMOL_Rhmol01G0183900 [Rhododendron molle]